MGCSFSLGETKSVETAVIGLHPGKYKQDIRHSNAQDSKLGLEMKISH